MIDAEERRSRKRHAGAVGAGELLKRRLCLLLLLPLPLVPRAEERPQAGSPHGVHQPGLPNGRGVEMPSLARPAAAAGREQGRTPRPRFRGAATLFAGDVRGWPGVARCGPCEISRRGVATGRLRLLGGPSGPSGVHGCDRAETIGQLAAARRAQTDARRACLDCVAGGARRDAPSAEPVTVTSFHLPSTGLLRTSRQVCWLRRCEVPWLKLQGREVRAFGLVGAELETSGPWTAWEAVKYGRRQFAKRTDLRSSGVSLASTGSASTRSGGSH